MGTEGLFKSESIEHLNEGAICTSDWSLSLSPCNENKEKYRGPLSDSRRDSIPLFQSLLQTDEPFVTELPLQLNSPPHSNEIQEPSNKNRFDPRTLKEHFEASLIPTTMNSIRHESGMTPLRQFASQIQSSFPTKHNGQTTQIDSLKTQTTVIDFLERKEPSLPQTHTQNCNTLQSSCQQSQSQSHNSLSKSTNLSLQTEVQHSLKPPPRQCVVGAAPTKIPKPPCVLNTRPNTTINQKQNANTPSLPPSKIPKFSTLHQTSQRISISTKNSDFPFQKGTNLSSTMTTSQCHDAVSVPCTMTTATPLTSKKHDISSCSGPLSSLKNRRQTLMTRVQRPPSNQKNKPSSPISCIDSTKLFEMQLEVALRTGSIITPKVSLCSHEESKTLLSSL